MLLRLVSPMRRSNSSNPVFVQRIPADVLPKLVGKQLSLPIGDVTVPVFIGPSTQAVRASLRTSEPSEVKVRQAELAGYLERVFSGLRTERPVSLSHRQATALAGELYRSWANGESRSHTLSVTMGDDGGVIDEEGFEGEAELVYAATLQMLEKAKEKEDAGKVDPVLNFEPMFGAIIDRLLLARGIAAVDPPTWGILLSAFWLAMRDAMELQGRNAAGDYRPDLKAERFPEWQAPAVASSPALPAVAKTTGPKLTISGLLEAWWTESRAAGLKPRTYQGYKATINKLIAFVGHDDASRVTPEDVVGFKDRRLTEASARTVKDADLAALKSVFAWAVRNRKLPSNPAEGITIRLAKPRRVRESGFRDEEVKALLSASLKVKRGNDRLQTFAAKRWITWLLAYTGARVGEIAQLRKEDVKKRGDYWSIVITPEAGTVKGNEPREVPLHPHLVETGFVEFAASAPEGHLFLKPNSKTDDVLGSLTGVKNRVREFVRQHVTDPNVQPNHAWRHLFMTRSRAAGVDQELRRMITGHSGAGVDERVYGDPAGLYREICKLPRFEVG